MTLILDSFEIKQIENMLKFLQLNNKRVPSITVDQNIILIRRI